MESYSLLDCCQSESAQLLELSTLGDDGQVGAWRHHRQIFAYQARLLAKRAELGCAIDDRSLQNLRLVFLAIMDEECNA